MALRRGGLKTGIITDCGPDVPAVWPESPLAGLDAALICVPYEEQVVIASQWSGPRIGRVSEVLGLLTRG